MRVQGRVQGRRGARTTAITNGGAIPDTAMFPVILQPEGVQIATLDEHFAVDSSPGDVVQLGNASWRIQRIESARPCPSRRRAGRAANVALRSAKRRSARASFRSSCAESREDIDRRTRNVLPGYISQANPEVADTGNLPQERVRCG